MNNSPIPYEETANLIRDEFLATLKVLHGRRRQFSDVRRRVTEHSPRLLAAAAGAAATGVLVGLVALRRHSMARYRLRRRLRGVVGAWSHPARQSRAFRVPLALEIARRLAVLLTVAVGARLARRLARQMVP